jgi:DNA-binding NarL/FixJ family response regulator
MSTTSGPIDLCAPLRLLVVDDHAIVREGIKRMLEAMCAHWTIDEAKNGHDALERLRSAECDVAIVDVSMPGMTGLEFLRRVRGDYPRLRVLMLSMHAEEQYAMRAFKAGAVGYVTKDKATDELRDALRSVIAGRIYVSASLAERMVLALNGMHESAGHAQLSDRELEVLRRLASGNSPAEIAQALNISTKTVSTHKTRILERLQLPNTASLIRYALEHDLMLDAIEPEAD